MNKYWSSFFLLGSVVVGIGAALPAHSQVALTDPTIYGNAPKEFPLNTSTSLPSYVFDNDTSTYYASADYGTDTFLDFDFSSPTYINGFDMTQRNDIARVLKSELIFDNDSDFSSPIATVQLNHTDTALAYNKFSFSTVYSRYVRWDVIETNDTFFRSNGAAEMTFYGPGPVSSAPSPATLLAVPAFAASISRIRRLRRRALPLTSGKASPS